MLSSTNFRGPLDSYESFITKDGTGAPVEDWAKCKEVGKSVIREKFPPGSKQCRWTTYFSNWERDSLWELYLDLEEVESMTSRGVFECWDPLPIENCVCPEDHFGNHCEYRTTYSCWFNITNPPLGEKCEGGDSFEYSNSVSGWDNCHKITPKGKQRFEGYLHCTNSHKKRPDYEKLIPKELIPSFEYDISKPDQDFYVSTYTNTTFTLLFFDWKWISKRLEFTTQVNKE